MKSASTLLTLCVYVTITSTSNAFLFSKKRDCSMSAWSEWTTPVGFSIVSRERAVLRFPTNGGKACPTNLQETKTTTSKPTLSQTATSVTKNFVRRGQTLSVNGRTVGQKRDLLIIIDSSGSVGKSNFEDSLDQIARLLGLLCPTNDPFSPNYQRAAVIKYSSSVVEVFDFDDNSNTLQLQNAIKNTGYLGQSTCTATAFRKAEDMLHVSRGMRIAPDVKQEVLILTDGQSNCGGNAILEAQNLQSKAEVFGLMIGSFSLNGEQELMSYVSQPVHDHLFAIPGYKDLKSLVDFVEAQLKLPQAPKCVPFDI